MQHYNQKTIIGKKQIHVEVLIFSVIILCLLQSSDTVYHRLIEFIDELKIQLYSFLLQHGPQLVEVGWKWILSMYLPIQLIPGVFNDIHVRGGGHPKQHHDIMVSKPGL